MVKVIFGRNAKPFSLAIRLFTWSRWSHCGLIDSTGKNVIEATAKHGVIITPLAEFKKRYKTFAITNMPTVKGFNPQDLARRQIGKRYDWLAIFALVFRADWDADNKWFCSELIAHCIGMYRKDRVSRITPEDLWKITR